MLLLTSCDASFAFLFFYYYLNHELCVFGSKLEVALPEVDYIEIPTGWWDAEADKSLLIGVHKHGMLKLLKDMYKLIQFFPHESF